MTSRLLVSIHEWWLSGFYGILSFWIESTHEQVEVTFLGLVVWGTMELGLPKYAMGSVVEKLHLRQWRLFMPMVL